MYLLRDRARGRLRYHLRGHEGKTGMARKCIIKVMVSPEQKAILCELSSRLGTSESETMRMALMDYAKELSLMSETIHRKRHNEKNTL